jgi:hypothetical protein
MLEARWRILVGGDSFPVKFGMQFIAGEEWLWLWIVSLECCTIKAILSV